MQATASLQHNSSAKPSRLPHWPALQGGAGARLPVSLTQCAVACTGAPGCDMFTYNGAQQGCFLKSGQCPLRNDCQVGAPRGSRIGDATAGYERHALASGPAAPVASGGWMFCLHCFLLLTQARLLPDVLAQPPPLTCWSVSDTGKNITTPCGTW